MKKNSIGSIALLLAAGTCSAQPYVTLSNGITGDGSLIVYPDAYGSTQLGYGNELYDPIGLLGPAKAAGLSCWFLFTPIEKVAFGEPFSEVDNTYNLRTGTFDLPAPTGPLNVFDSDGDGIDDTATSSWQSMNFALSLVIDFNLTQQIRKPDRFGVSEYTQTLIVTNNSGGSRTFSIYRVNPSNLQWDGSVMDEVGTSRDFNGQIVPFVSDPDGSNFTSVALTGSPAFIYSAMRSGWDPDGPGGDPPMNWHGGQIWDNFGLYESWKNETAGIGQAPLTGSIPGKQPPVFWPDNRAAAVLAWEMTLADGQSKTLTATSQYGTNGEPGLSCPCACDFDSNGHGVCDVFDFLAFQNAWVTSDPCACNIDISTGFGVCDIFDFLAFQNEFVGGCP